MTIPYQFHLHSVMEYLVQIQSSVITLYSNSSHTIEIVTTSFDSSQRRKISSININSFILLIISEFIYIVPISPWRAHDPRMIDSSRFRSHSSFIQSLVLSNTIQWQSRNALYPILTLLRQDRFDRLNLFSFNPTPPWITIDSTQQQISFNSFILDIHNTDEWTDNKCSEGGIQLLTVIKYSRQSASLSLSINQSYLNKSFLSLHQSILSSQCLLD